MMMLRKEKIIFVILVIFVLVTAVNFQYFWRGKTKESPPRFKPKELRVLNNGLPYSSKGVKYAQDQILVKFNPSLSTQDIRATVTAYKTKRMKRIPNVNVYQLELPKDVTVEEMIYVMSQNPDIEYVEPNYIAHITVTPDDTFFEFQYALFNSGQEIGIPGSPHGRDRADIKATSAWDETKGDEGIVIAVIDTGIDLEHPDIRDEISSTGRDFVNDDFDATDDNGHGTHVAGIAAASTDNGEGIAGVAWNCRVLPIKSMDEEGSGYYSWIIEGIEWAVDNGADVINLSLGGDVPSQGLEDAVRYAFQEGVVVVAAAGNDSDSVLYPGAYDAYCLAVAATDYDDLRPDWSNFGPEVDVAAPGERILSLVPTWFWEPGAFPYAFGSGTSAATPHAAGLAALIKSIKPWLTVSEIMNVIRYSADDVNSVDYPGNDEYIGYGRINMEKALVPIKITTSAR